MYMVCVVDVWCCVVDDGMEVTLKEIVDGWLTFKPEDAKLPDTLYLQVDRGPDMFNK
jgi:hypothetical protein